MKLQLKKATALPAPNWHPNFRNSEVLPDLKVVRTTFFVNVASITVALAAVLFTVFREYNAISLRGEIAAAEKRIEATAADNSRLLGLNREFSEAARKFAEAEKFLGAPIVASELLVALSRSLPGYMDFTGVVYENDQLVLRGTIRGASDTASTRVSGYLDTLRGDATLGKRFPDISLTSLLRDPRTQGLSFEILLRPGAAPSAANPAKT